MNQALPLKNVNIAVVSSDFHRIIELNGPSRSTIANCYHDCQSVTIVIVVINHYYHTLVI